MRTRPEPFTLPVILCPNCGHGIDPHSRDNGTCLVGDDHGVPCDCRWSPNDIAGLLLADERERLWDKVEALPVHVVDVQPFPKEPSDYRDAVLLDDMRALLGCDDE